MLGAILQELRKLVCKDMVLVSECGDVSNVRLFLGWVLYFVQMAEAFQLVLSIGTFIIEPVGEAGLVVGGLSIGFGLLNYKVPYSSAVLRKSFST